MVELQEDWQRIGMAFDQVQRDAVRHAGSHPVPTPPAPVPVARSWAMGELSHPEDTAIPGRW
jgi:hypothetical protein